MEITANFEKILFSEDESRCFVSKCPNVKKTNQKCEFWKGSKTNTDELEIGANFEKVKFLEDELPPDQTGISLLCGKWLWTPL